MSGNSYATQARIVPGTGPGNPLPPRPAAGGRGKEALWYRDDETLQDLAELSAAARSGKLRCLASAPLAGPPDAGALASGSRVEPTVVDFYNRLDRLEARVEEASRLLVQALAQLPKDDDSDLLEELLADEQQEIAEQLRETRHEQAETRMDLQKVGQVVETAQNWAYISIAAVFVWKVVAVTWNRFTPPTPRQESQPQKPPQAGSLALLQEAERAIPGDPFYMV